MRRVGILGRNSDCALIASRGLLYEAAGQFFKCGAGEASVYTLLLTDVFIRAGVMSATCSMRSKGCRPGHLRRLS